MTSKEIVMRSWSTSPRTARNLAYCLLAVAVVFSVAKTVAVALGDLGLLDLSVYRVGALALIHDQPLYDAQEPRTGLPFTYPPFAAVAFTPLAAAGPRLAEIALTIMSYIALSRVVWLADRHARTPLLGIPDRRARLALIASFCLFAQPVLATLSFGQINLLLMWAVCESWLATAKSRSVLIGLAAGIKLTPAYFVMILAVSREWRRASWAVAGLAITVLVGLGARTQDTLKYFLEVGTDASRVGNPSYPGNQSINGWLARGWENGQPQWLWLLLACVVGLAACALSAWFWRNDDRLGSLAVGSLGMLLISPISWSHHWVWWPIVLLALLTGEPMISRIRYVVSALIAVAVVTPLIWLPPRGDGLESNWGILEALAGNSYVFLGLASLGLFGVIAHQSRSRTIALASEVPVALPA